MIHRGGNGTRIALLVTFTVALLNACSHTGTRGQPGGTHTAQGDGTSVCVSPKWVSPGFFFSDNILVDANIVRDRSLIAEFQWEGLVDEKAVRGVGGITQKGVLFNALSRCSDSPWEEFADAGTSVVDPFSGLRIDVTTVKDAGPSGRGWSGVRCGYRILDPQDPNRYAELSPQETPAFNFPTGVWRDGNAVFVAFGFNGSAKDGYATGNQIVALDLCEHTIVWSSDDLTANGAFIVLEDLIISGYGFTQEEDWLYLLDKATGTIVEKHPLPVAPSEMRFVTDGQEKQLLVRLYDGYARFTYRKGN